MGDFLISISGSSRDVRLKLPPKGPGEKFHHTFAWGCAAIQRPCAKGYSPYDENGAFVFAVGMPRIIGLTHEAAGKDGFARHIYNWVRDRSLPGNYQQLTGGFAVCVCLDDQILVLTDPLGFYPVYISLGPEGNVLGIGTNVDVVARLATQPARFDHVSLAELLLNETITFPFTTRENVRELEPGSIHIFSSCGKITTSEQCYIPREPDKWTKGRDSVDELVAALQEAGKDITRGANRVAVTLSGGADSRTVLSCIPHSVRACGITYMDHPNNEFRTAARLADAAGLRHLAAKRDPDYYADLVVRELELLGNERVVGNAHGLCIRDAGLENEFDLLVGGFLSDTLLKGALSPYTVKRALLKHLAPFGIGLKPNYLRYNRAATQERARHIRPDLVVAAGEREQARLHQLRLIRPITAEEWVSFYPLSRQYVLGYALANARFYNADELFLHKAIIEVARTAHPLEKALGKLARRAFRLVNGSLSAIPNSNTNLRPDAGFLRSYFYSRFRHKLQSQPVQKSYPWFTDHSWGDWAQLQSHSPRWRDVCTPALSPDAFSPILAKVLTPDCVAKLPAVPCDDPSFIIAMVQISMAIRKVP